MVVVDVDDGIVGGDGGGGLVVDGGGDGKCGGDGGGDGKDGDEIKILDSYIR